MPPLQKYKLELYLLQIDPEVSIYSFEPEAELDGLTNAHDLLSAMLDNIQGQALALLKAATIGIYTYHFCFKELKDEVTIVDKHCEITFSGTCHADRMKEILIAILTVGIQGMQGKI